MWWNNADQQQLLQQMQNQQNLETAVSSSSQTQQNQMFSYKMANSFENTNTSNSNADSNQFNASGIDYSQQNQWWNYQQDMQNTGLQGLQNMSNQQEHHLVGIFYEFPGVILFFKFSTLATLSLVSSCTKTFIILLPVCSLGGSANRRGS